MSLGDDTRHDRRPPELYVVQLEGQSFRLVPYGSERIDGSDVFREPCNLCGASPGTLHSPRCRLGAGHLHSRPEHCRDCGVAIGEVHVKGCVVEQCPRCGGQYMSCACSGSEDSDEPESA